MAKNNYSCLSDSLESLTKGYLIVGNFLFEIVNSNVEDCWELRSGSIEQKVEEAREIAGISSMTEIIYDDEGIYDEEILQDEGRLCSPFERQLTEDEESFAEYCNEHY